MTETGSFGWIEFYAEFADKLLKFRRDRGELLNRLQEMYRDIRVNFPKVEDGDPVDIDPFTVFGFFNKGLADETRIKIATGLRDEFGIHAQIPTSFAGIPVLNNFRAAFYDFKGQRGEDDIENLWEMFEQAILFASDESGYRKPFEMAFDQVRTQGQVKWNLTMGLYWIRPLAFLNLDSRNRDFIRKERALGDDCAEAVQSMKDKLPKAVAYLRVRDLCKSEFEAGEYPFESFPDLSYHAWVSSENEKARSDSADNVEGSNHIAGCDDLNDEPDEEGPGDSAYSIDQIISDGSFLSRDEIERILNRLKAKKNIILQGPPGTGKTWLARKLGYALMGSRDINRVRAIQFHPNLSYEDFVRGYRPSSKGELALTDGPFLKAVTAAQADPDRPYVVLIEEINRGNPAQLFGEMLTLLEADKRNEYEALELAYPRGTERVYIPPNLYVIGTMNVADRSLAIVDMALRRRFAFIDLAPTYNDAWRDWVNQRFGIDAGYLDMIANRIRELNQRISTTPSLGPQCAIGHSFFTPPLTDEQERVEDAHGWYESIVRTEIKPLLQEYWFDSEETVKQAEFDLLDGMTT